MDILDLAKKRIVILDGAMGTAIQALKLTEDAFGGYKGCNEYLVLSAPEKILEIHKAYFKAGADVVETDTFGANPSTLAEYGLAEKTEEINRAAAQIAKKAATDFSTPQNPKFVAGSIGPGMRLPSLGQISFDELYNGYRRQTEALIEGGANMLIIETCQDLLQIKSATIAAKDSMKSLRKFLPIYVSVTVEQSGTLLTGSDISAVIAVLSPLDIDILGLNCATGPLPMRPHLEVLAKRWSGFTGIYPNAGLPIPTARGVIYPETADEFSATLAKFASELPVNFIGGCCGTTPAHIKVLADALKGKPPKEKRVTRRPAVASLFSAVEINQDIPPLYVGERANATGSKAFRDALLKGDRDGAFRILIEQEELGSHLADLSVAYTGLDEIENMKILVSRAARECKLPLSLDSNSADVIEAALKLYPGRPIINSINLEDGGERAKRVCNLAKRFGAALICLAIDERGMAMTAERKLEVAKRLVSLCVDDHNLRRSDLFIDPLTFTVASGEPTLKTAAIETLEAINRIKSEIPGVFTLLGVSNISYGLSQKARRALNSVFLSLAVKEGLDAAILNPKHIIPLAELDEQDRERALDLLFNRSRDDKEPLEEFINHFSARESETEKRETKSLSPELALFRGIVKGDAKAVLANIPTLLKERSAEEILNDILVPAMERVGELFGSGELQLPFVLKSAEAMKRGVDELKPYFKSDEKEGKRKRLIIATVRGDVHDIGKNLVSIIISNNGFDVVDLGTKVPVEVIISEAKRTGADVIGMSGLLVSSALVMEENLRAMSDAGLTLPVLVGGAALTPEFTENALIPSYKTGFVAYCKDAFAGLTAMQDIAEGREPGKKPRKKKATLPADSISPKEMKIQTVEPPKPPFYGSRIAEFIPLDSIFSLLNETALFRGRWGFRRGKIGAGEYEELIEKEARPKYQEMLRIIKLERIFKPKIVYGWFKGHSADDTLVVEHNGREFRFNFPRRKSAPKICVADFFRRDEDIVGFFVVTLGGEISSRGKDILEKAGYLDYYLLSGLAAEATDALAEYCHDIMRIELGFKDAKPLAIQDRIVQNYRGGRYGFGYPACPDLSANELVFELLDAGRIGVSLSETFQMIPEYSTSALVAHHPQAKYFSV
ncbi:MAG: methionine synthase [Myxococcota bacterium]